MKKHLAVFLAVSFFFILSIELEASVEPGTTTALRTGWYMSAAENVAGEDSSVSQPSFDASKWYAIREMPSTVLQTLEDDGIYKNLYYGKNLAQEVPGDLWKKNWWYRTTFVAPAKRDAYSLIFKGISYRADVWLNGHKIADRSKIVGMYNSYELDVSSVIRPGAENVLAVKVIPEQALPDINGVELADSWLDWINWKYIGYHNPDKHLDISFVPDRNAGVWKNVFLSSTGKVAIRNPYVATDLPLPATSPASLTVYCDLRNPTLAPVSGTLQAEISRAGKPTINLRRKIDVPASATTEVALTPADYTQLSVDHPDLWWPYQWGRPNLYQLKLTFEINGKTSDAKQIDFGIRKVTQKRDSDESFPGIGRGGSFYLQVNGKDFLIRGAAYTPDLLFKHDPQRDRAIMNYVKDLRLNLLRWELKISDNEMLELADREGVATMFGWMCCAQWEKWPQWSEEDRRVARESMAAQLHELRAHPSVFVWANGSDGLPPEPVLNEYHQILHQQHWQNAIVDTVSHVNRAWSGIHMAGPYVWRPPYYWFSEKFGPARGSSAEEGDNEIIPPLESIKKFIPADKLWPINDYWYFHSGANEGNNTLQSIKSAVDRRYGSSQGLEEFAKKAQLAHYENVRAQFETYAASGWPTHKMMVYWMLDNHWPSFFGHLFDYYLKQGGAYFGAKKALRPLSVVYDYYASGDRNTAKIYVTNQTLETRDHLKVSVRFYNIDGTQKYSKEVRDVSVGPNTGVQVMSLPWPKNVSSTFFVRCKLQDSSGASIVENIYWQSTVNDELDPKKDEQFSLVQTKWADYSLLNTMRPADVSVSWNLNEQGAEDKADITLTNTSDQVAFFIRAEITKGAGGEEVLPSTYDDNYITIFPHESRTVQATFSISALSGAKPGLRLEGYNVRKGIFPVEAAAGLHLRRSKIAQ